MLEHLDVLAGIYRSQGLDEKLRGLEEKRQDLLDPSVYVFIIGEGNSGKSSLINHLLGVAVAETSMFPKTWRVDLYRPAPDGREFAELTRYGRDTPELLSVEGAHNICDDQEQEVFERIKSARMAAGVSDRQDLVASEGQVIQVEWNRAGLALDERVTLVDTPGFAQPRGRASARADALRRSEGVAYDIDDISDFYYHRSDLVLWAFKATKLEDDDTLKSLELLSKETKRVLGVLTHWDRIDEADRPGRLREARKRYGDYVFDFVCVDCKGAPGVPREDVAELRDWLRSEADRAAAVKLESARAYCLDQARFAAEWLQSPVEPPTAHEEILSDPRLALDDEEGLPPQAADPVAAGMAPALPDLASDTLQDSLWEGARAEWEGARKSRALVAAGETFLLRDVLSQYQKTLEAVLNVFLADVPSKKTLTGSFVREGFGARVRRMALEMGVEMPRAMSGDGYATKMMAVARGRADALRPRALFLFLDAHDRGRTPFRRALWEEARLLVLIDRVAELRNQHAHHDASSRSGPEADPVFVEQEARQATCRVIEIMVAAFGG